MHQPREPKRIRFVVLQRTHEAQALVRPVWSTHGGLRPEYQVAARRAVRAACTYAPNLTRYVTSEDL
jgi:hypothetical protein